MKVTLDMWDSAKVVNVKIGRKPVKINITGHRDPRGPDNGLLVFVDPDDDTLHIIVPKADRCYKFDRYIDHGGAIEFIAK